MTPVCLVLLRHGQSESNVASCPVVIMRGKYSAGETGTGAR
jgi:broad specificity phosphatase PhoE